MFIKSPFECGRNDESREQTFENVSWSGSARRAESEEGSAQVKQLEPLSVAAKEKADLRDSENFELSGPWKEKTCVCMVVVVVGGVSDHLET